MSFLNGRKPFIWVAVATICAVLLWTGFSPKSQSSMTMTYRGPVFQMVERGESIELKTKVQLSQEEELRVPRSNAIWLPGTSQNLTVVVSGLVGDSKGSLNLYLAEKSIAAGHSILILPSPTHWAFAWRRIEMADRFDYDRSVQELCDVFDELKSSKPWHEKFHSEAPEKITLIGLSLGARHALSMMSCLREKSSQVSVVAINPPLDLKYAVDVIDGLSKRMTENRSRAYSVGFLLSALRPFAAGAQALFGPGRGLDILLRPVAPFPDALADLAGASFSARMEQVITGEPTNFDSLSTRASDFSFKSFAEKGPITAESFRAELRHSLKSLQGRILLFHSADDFLIRAGDLVPIQEQLKERAYISSTGGHGGLIFEPAYLERLTWFLY